MSPPTPMDAGKRLPGYSIGNEAHTTSVIAYADDITIFVTSVADFPIIDQTIHLFQRTSGARLNPWKSKAHAGEGWCTWETFLGIDYHPHVTLFGVTFWGTIRQTMKESWARLTTKLRMQAKQAYAGIFVSHASLLSKICYNAQRLPATRS